MNPFRPRIVSAGVWFLLFVGIPFLLHLNAKEIIDKPGKFQNWMRKPSAYVLFYAASSFFLGAVLGQVFETQSENSQPAWIFNWWALSLALLLASVGFSFDFWGLLPKFAANIISLVFAGYLFAYGLWDAVFHDRASWAAVTLWILVTGWAALVELNSRSWKWKAGNWMQSLAYGIAALFFFSTFYFPKMKSSWGGGHPIPVTIYFTKGSPIMPNQSVAVQLIDVTDVGLYVIARSDRKATFIPLSEVGMIYYDDKTSGFFLAKPK